MILTINENSLRALATKIKEGSFVNISRMPDKGLSVMLKNLTTHQAEFSMLGKDFKEVFEGLLDNLNPDGKDKTQFYLDDALENVVKDGFSLKIGSVVNKNPSLPNRADRFTGYYFSLSNGALNSEVRSNMFTDGLQQIANEARQKFSAPIEQ